MKNLSHLIVFNLFSDIGLTPIGVKGIMPYNPEFRQQVLDTVIKWYFKCIRLRRDKHTREVIVVALPDYTIHEIKELYTSILA